jgi:chromate transporter
MEALAGINAAVVGILAAALYNPVIITAVHDLVDAALVGAGFWVFVRWNVPPLVVLVACLGYALIRFALVG